MSLIPTAFADAPVATVATAHQASPWPTIAMLVVFFGVFYFLMIRPQSKKAKQHREMINALAKGDEVITSGGMMAKVTDLDDSSVTLEISPGVQVKHQRSAIAAVLPKGSIK